METNEENTDDKRSKLFTSNKTCSTRRCVSKKSEEISEKKPSLDEEITKPLPPSISAIKSREIKKEEPSSSKILKQELSDEQWEPPNWEIVLDNIRKMRSKERAPVDTMGCHKCADENADARVCLLRIT